MASWEVLVRVQGYVDVEADSKEEAESIAESIFDPTVYDTEIVESFESENENGE